MSLVNPTYRNMPMAQNLFYHPMSKPEDNTQPSPMINLRAFSGLRDNIPMFQSQSNIRQEIPINNLGANRNHELINSLTSLLNSGQNQASAQPRNLNELLQKSFSSSNSNSILQSPFISSHQSQFAGQNIMQSPYTHNIITPDYSNFLTSSVLETPVQSANIFKNPMSQQHAVQPTEGVNDALLLQLARLLKQDNGENIKSALADIIDNYNAVNPPSQDRRTQTDFGQNYYQQHNLQNGPRTISLSNGVIMQSLNRGNNYNAMNNRLPNILMNNGMNNVKRDVMMFNDPSTKKANHCSIIPEENSTMLCDVSFSNQKPESTTIIPQPSSPNQNLNKKLNSLDINANTQGKSFKISPF